MKSTIEIIIISALAYLCMFIVAKLFWLIYPYPENSSQQQIELVWGIHVLSEKIFSYLLTALISIYAVCKFKLSYGIKCIALALVGAISYHIIGGLVWVVRFGYEPYLQNSMPLKMLFIVVVISSVVSLASYKLLPNQQLKKDAASGAL
jgi:hypothetical protein